MISTIWTLGTLAMMFCGCSFGMRGVDPKWDGKQEPVCFESYAPVIVDALTASSIAGVLAQGTPEGQPPLDGSIVAGGILISLLYTVSASVGASKYSECRVAKADWYVREAIRESSAKADVASSSPATPSSQLASTPPIQQAATANSTGYFCTSSRSRPDSEICRRERTACERARAAIAARGSEECTPRNVAWCFDTDRKPRCFTTRQTCKAQIATTTAASGACTARLLTTN